MDLVLERLKRLGINNPLSKLSRSDEKDFYIFVLMFEGKYGEEAALEYV